MAKRSKLAPGIMRQGKCLQIQKNQSYKGIDGCLYIPRSFFYAKGDGYKIAIFDKLEISDSDWRLHQIVLNGEEFKKLIGLNDEGSVTII